MLTTNHLIRHASEADIVFLRRCCSCFCTCKSFHLVTHPHAVSSHSKVAKSSWQRILMAWIYVPFGVTCILAICFGVDSLIGLSSVSFPASVACMIGLFVLLIICQGALGDRKTKRIVALVDIPVIHLACASTHLTFSSQLQCGFALRYINLFFCPAFVTLPLSPSISGVEVGKIIAVFSQSSLQSLSYFQH